jgi:hypothetical protein
MSQTDQLLEEFSAPTLDDQFGASVVLLRSTHQTAPFVATWANVTHEVQDDRGLPQRWTGRDFILPADKLVIDSQQIEPRSGDQLTLTENGVTLTFALLPVGKLPAAELLPGGYRWRVHTKKDG